MDRPTAPRIDLGSCAVFVDFDGTASTRDVGLVLLERFCPGRFEEVDGRYESGAIGSRQYVRELWPLLDGVGRDDLERAASQVPLDPGFGPLVAYLREEGAEVSVVSDGLGFYVGTACAPYEVDVVANTVDWATRRPGFPFARPDCPCALCGACKALPVREARDRGLFTVVVGDGTSDRFGAAEADLVFAKDRLVAWCHAAATPFEPWETMADVEAGLRARAGHG